MLLKEITAARFGMTINGNCSFHLQYILQGTIFSSTENFHFSPMGITLKFLKIKIIFLSALKEGNYYAVETVFGGKKKGTNFC